MKNLEEVLSRQVVEILPSREGLARLMRRKKIRLYMGVDPTSPDLHLGHAVALRKLRQFQELGHEVILLFGTLTARIGDPTGKDQARQPLSDREIKENIRTYRKQAGLVLDMKRLRIEQNHTWLGKMSVQETQKLASHATVSHLLERDMFQERRKRGQPVWLHEMFYPLLQGYDSVALDVDLEVGGTDQTFNMLVGRELQRAYRNKEKYTLTTPLLLGLDGRKMSKSFGNTINLLDKPEDMYGKTMSLRDDLIQHYFELVTDVPQEEMEKAVKLPPREAKARLAQTIVETYHGASKAKKAKEEFEKVFQKKELPSEMPQVRLRKKTLTLLELLEQARAIASRAEGRRLVQQGGVKLDGTVQQDPNALVRTRSGLVIQIGKRRFFQVA